MVFKKINLCILLLISSVYCLANSLSLQSLPSPYNQLNELLPFNNHGWYSNGPWIEKLMKNNNVQTVVEVGSWLGLSTRHIASLLSGKGKLYAIDTWEGSVEHQDVQFSVVLPTLYEQFLSNVIHSGFTDKIVPLKMTSLEAADKVAAYGDHFDLIYIDAAHDTESVYNDLVAYFPLTLKNHGILCGDDWWWQSVQVAVLRFAQERQLTVYTHYASSNFWFFKDEGKYELKSMLDASDEAFKFSTRG